MNFNLWLNLTDTGETDSWKFIRLIVYFAKGDYAAREVPGVCYQEHTRKKCFCCLKMSLKYLLYISLKQRTLGFGDDPLNKLFQETTRIAGYHNSEYCDETSEEPTPSTLFSVTKTTKCQFRWFQKPKMKYNRVNKRKKSTGSGREVIVEPVRRSIADVVETNLKIAKRVTFLHRLIYIGQYFFTDNNNIVDALEKNYKQSNSGYCTESLSGILLYYPRHFCYIVEGSEEVLNKHLSLLFDELDGCIFNVKLLSAIHHIKGRFWSEWMSYYGRPSERVEEIDPESDLDNSMRYITECCEKLYNFANSFITDQLKLRVKYLEKEQEESSESDEERDSTSTATGNEPLVTAYVKSKSFVERDPYGDYLPELKLLDFLISCKHCKDLKQYHQYFKYIGQSADYTLKVWPAPTTIIPYDVFDKPYHPIDNLPTSQMEEAAEEVPPDQAPDGELEEMSMASALPKDVNKEAE